jgi:mevalonate kinase
MPAISASAPGKIILFGEHAVVYGRPAIAAPVHNLRAKTIVSANPKARTGSVHIQAPDIHLDIAMDDLASDHPLATIVHGVAKVLEINHIPACTIRITSTIPIAGGIGSGAAVSVSLIRAFSAFLGHPLDNERVSLLAYEVEKIYHGTPSGVDNHVVTYAVPVYFIKGHPVAVIKVKKPFTLVIGDTGIRSPTARTVADVRNAWQTEPSRYDRIFDQVGDIVDEARLHIEGDLPDRLGALMNSNHKLLQDMGVSSRELDQLVDGAIGAGALGAKLSGGGRGGNMIALAGPRNAHSIAQALRSSGASTTLITEIKG